MKILAIDSSAITASVAVSEDESILAEAFVNNGLTHSQTLLPMVKDVLSKANLSVKDLDLLAVTAGPGSFTGVRIGVALLKGLAFEKDIPCVGVSTPELIAAGVKEKHATVVSCMDARRNQFYTASFESISLRRLCEDEALGMEALGDRIAAYPHPVILAGDGAKAAYALLKDRLPQLQLASEDEIYQNAKNLCAIALRRRAEAVSGEHLVPTYLRMSQAERELKKKRGETK